MECNFYVNSVNKIGNRRVTSAAPLKWDKKKNTRYVSSSSRLSSLVFTDLGGGRSGSSNEKTVHDSLSTFQRC